MNNQQCRAYYRHDKDAVEGAIKLNYLCSHGDSWHEFHADDFFDDLWDEGYVVLPRTFIGSSGWTPGELWAYQAGIMAAMSRTKETIAEAMPEG